MTVPLKQYLLFSNNTVLDSTLWKPQKSSRDACAIFASCVSFVFINCLEIEAKFKNCSPPIPESVRKCEQVSVLFLMNLGRLHGEIKFQAD